MKKPTPTRAKPKPKAKPHAKDRRCQPSAAEVRTRAVAVLLTIAENPGHTPYERSLAADFLLKFSFTRARGGAR